MFGLPACLPAYPAAAPPHVQAEQEGGDATEIVALRRKAELIQEAEAIKKRMRESQLTRWGGWVSGCAWRGWVMRLGD